MSKVISFLTFCGWRWLHLCHCTLQLLPFPVLCTVGVATSEQSCHTGGCGGSLYGIQIHRLTPEGFICFSLLLPLLLLESLQLSKKASDSFHGLCQGALGDNTCTRRKKKKNILKYIFNRKRFSLIAEKNEIFTFVDRKKHHSCTL